MDKFATILVTAAGTATSVGAIKYISEIEGIRIVTTDIHPAELVPATRKWATKHFQVPLATESEAFVGRLIEICIAEEVNFLYPVHDLEIAAVIQARELFPERVGLPALSSETVRSCTDKWLNYNECISANLPVPETWMGSELPTDVFVRHGELVRKPRSGVGSVGVRIVKSFHDLDAEEDLGCEVIYQTFRKGIEYTVDVLRLEGIFYAVTRERLETKVGICTKAHVSVEPSLTRLARDISDRFALQGLFCFQVIREDADTFNIIDINPRCGGGTALTAAAGFPIYETYFSTMLRLNQRHQYKTLCDERLKVDGAATVCRFYEEVVTQTRERAVR